MALVEQEMQGGRGGVAGGEAGGVGRAGTARSTLNLTLWGPLKGLIQTWSDLDLGKIT